MTVDLKELDRLARQGAEIHSEGMPEYTLSVGCLSLIQELEQFKNNLRTATNVLQSVVNGKTSPQLAQAVVNALNEFQDAAIAKEQV